jgi:hypothetical protein
MKTPPRFIPTQDRKRGWVRKERRRAGPRRAGLSDEQPDYLLGVLTADRTNPARPVPAEPLNQLRLETESAQFAC